MTVETPATPAAPGDAAGVAFSLMEGPDGRTWVGLQLRTVFLTAVLSIDPDNADTVAEMIAGEIKRAGREARRMNRRPAGLTLPTLRETRDLTPPN